MLTANAMSTAPRLSVIVAIKNPGERLRAALASVWSQRHVESELIVIDRGSTDGSRAWLDAQADRIGELVSEPAGGVYDALNRGIAAAHGEWVQFFSAEARLVGDLVLSEVLNWTKKTEAGVVVGETAYDHGRIEKLSSRVNPIAGNFVPLTSAFYRRSLFEENGSFDVTLPRHADYELNLRLWKNRVRFKPIPLRVVASAAPARDGRARTAWQEEIRARHRYFPTLRCVAWDARSIVRGGWSRIATGFSRESSPRRRSAD